MQGALFRIAENLKCGDSRTADHGQSSELHKSFLKSPLLTQRDTVMLNFLNIRFTGLQGFPTHILISYSMFKNFGHATDTSWFKSHLCQSVKCPSFTFVAYITQTNMPQGIRIYFLFLYLRNNTSDSSLSSFTQNFLTWVCLLLGVTGQFDKLKINHLYLVQPPIPTHSCYLSHVLFCFTHVVLLLVFLLSCFAVTLSLWL